LLNYTNLLIIYLLAFRNSNLLIGTIN